jgi:hypothetical protein
LILKDETQSISAAWSKKRQPLHLTIPCGQDQWQRRARPRLNLLAFGAILRHRPPLDQDEEVGEGGRTAAAISDLTIRRGFDGERGRTTFVSSEESLHLDALSFSHGLALGPPFFSALRISGGEHTCGITAFVDPKHPVEFFLTARDRVSRHHKSAWRVHRPERD